MRRDRAALLASAVLLIILALSYQWNKQQSLPTWRDALSFASFTGKHHIQKLIDSARKEHDRVHTPRVDNVRDAARAYRDKRGRHPPPQFDKWVTFALSRTSLLNEHLFDQIYEDLEPFWALEPLYLRTAARTWDGSISIRNGTARLRATTHWQNRKWISLWLAALEDILADLPDMDLAINPVDEPGVITSWEEMSRHMAIALATRHTRPGSSSKPIFNDYTPYPEPSENPAASARQWADDIPFWHKARRACHPESAARKTEIDSVIAAPPSFEGTGNPYVSNFTSARSACDQPQIASFHGSFIAPGSDFTSNLLFPLFSACKLTGVNNDILLPPAMYYDKDINFSGGDNIARHFPWDDKKPVAFWRGSPSGGSPEASDWRHFARQRLVSMLNASQVSASERLHYIQDLSFDEQVRLVLQTPLNIPMPDPVVYPLAALQSQPTSLGAWTAQIGDAGFTHLMCTNSPFSCPFMEPFYEVVEQVPLPEIFHYKFLPDADGMAYSGRYHSFLDSSSLPIKATVFSEWHDSRLIPWYHFVPMDNTFNDWWGIMEFFAGYDPATVSASAAMLRSSSSDSDTGADGDSTLIESELGAGGQSTQSLQFDKRLYRKAHDHEAQLIAQQGMEWSAQVLRPDDMTVYMYRLLLEYARICDERREQMGWVDDLEESS